MKWSSPNNATAFNEALAISGARVSFPKSAHGSCKMRFGAEPWELGNCFSLSGCTEFVPIRFYKLYLAIKFKLFSEKNWYTLYELHQSWRKATEKFPFWKRNHCRSKLTKRKIRSQLEFIENSWIFVWKGFSGKRRENWVFSRLVHLRQWRILKLQVLLVSHGKLHCTA